MTELTEFVERQSRQVLMALGYVLLILFGLIDHLADGLGFEPFYAIPAALVTWFGTRRAGVAAACTGGIVWGLANGVFSGEETNLGPTLWTLLWEFGLLFSIVFLVDAIKRSRRFMAATARTDPLTGLATRTCFEELARNELGRTKRYGRPFTLIVLRFGPPDGEQTVGPGSLRDIMPAAAEAIRPQLRETDLFARIDEFTLAALLPETAHDPSKAVVQKMLGLLAAVQRGRRWQLRFGVGAVTYEIAPESTDEMMRRGVKLADSASRVGGGAVKYETCRGAGAAAG
ncbi:GGDEF domain-containing protein [Geobacter anodireducens]|uniref:Diguanylate cyclase n=1 Tax=Geobacter soli TaxID=1510391 RepID=A0A0C1U661_9BACT|nr:GGDEF domain-containing protein [Geobacter soli]KIE43200.1 diguanylate cyclase [Geobacter soli]